MGELKHLSTPRKRDYSLSSGERKGRSPNRTSSVVLGPMLGRGCKAQVEGTQGTLGKLQTDSSAEGPWKGPPQRVRAP